MQKTASVGHPLFEGALGNSALLLLYFDFRLGERALRPAQLLYEQPFALLAIERAPAKSKGDEASPVPPDLAFAPSFMFAPPIIGRYVPLSVWPQRKAADALSRRRLENNCDLLL